jgi:hypothetical protein
LWVRSRRDQQLEGAFEGFDTLVYDPSRRYLSLAALSALRRIVKRNESRQTSKHWLLLRILRPKVVVTGDGYLGLRDLYKILKDSKLFVIAHGLYLEQSGSSLIREHLPDAIPADLTLFSIGEYDRVHYQRWGLIPSTIVPIGTITNSEYSIISSRSKLKMVRRFDLCIVEKGISLSPADEFESWIHWNWKTFLELLSGVCKKRSELRIAVCLSGTNQQTVAERAEWLQQFFSTKLTFTWLGDDKWGSYKFIDQSNLAIGAYSTSLAEALARRKKILSFNMTSHSIWNFPGDGIHRLLQPTEADLTERIELLLDMSTEDYFRHLPIETRSLCSLPPEGALALIRSSISSQLFANGITQ